MKKVFIGPKQKTISNSLFFDASITLVGNGTNNNIAFSPKAPFEFWNPDNILLEVDIYNKQIKKLNYSAEIMAFNPKLVSKCTFPNNLKQICKNNFSLLEILDNKIKTRELMKHVVPMLDYYTIKGKNFEYKKLSSISSNLVVQSPSGSGGSKTFFCNSENYKLIESKLTLEEDYSISIYQSNNISYSILCIIGCSQIELMPPCQQLFNVSNIIEWDDSNYNIDMPKHAKIKIIEYSLKICQKLKLMGYVGVLGIDYIYVDKELYFIEINPRFQGTTHMVDAFLKESSLPSIFDYNYRAFKNQEMPSAKNMNKSIFI